MTVRSGDPSDGAGTPADGGSPAATDLQALRERVEELTADDRRRDRRLLWQQAAVVLLIAAALVARALWLA